MITALDKQTALVLIDLQNGIMQQKLASPIEDILGQVAKLVAAFRKADLPIVIVNVNPAHAAWVKSRKDDKSWKSSEAIPPEFFEIVPEVKTQSNDIFITKHTWSAFYETSLDEELKKKNVTGIVLAGVATSIGVEGTARSAMERGYNISFVNDAMTDRVADAHENSLKYIFPRIGETGNTDEIITKLLNL